jgi:hypothetical protein
MQLSDLSPSVIDGLSDTKRRQVNPSIDITENIIAALETFQDGLSKSQDMIVTLPGIQTSMRITHVGRMGANLLVFEGELINGTFAKAIMHCSQVSLVRSTIPKANQAAHRIGFDVSQSTE